MCCFAMLLNPLQELILKEINLRYDSIFIADTCTCGLHTARCKAGYQRLQAQGLVDETPPYNLPHTLFSICSGAYYSACAGHSSKARLIYTGSRS